MFGSDRKPARGPGAHIGDLPSLPVFMRLRGRRAIVAGNSAGAAWKAELLAAAGATVDLLAPDPAVEIAQVIAKHPRIRLIDRKWADRDLAGAAIAVGDLLDPHDAEAFLAAAQAAGVPANLVDNPTQGDFQFGAIVERSPLVVAISTDGAAPVFAQFIRTRIEALLPQGFRQWAEAARTWRARLRPHHLDFRTRRSFWEGFVRLVRESPERAADDEAFETLLASVAGSTALAAAMGRVTLVGAGPGDPELLTLKAVRALQSADVVLHDDLVSPQIVAMARREATILAVGKRGYKPSCTQEDITALLVELAQTGKHVVRLKGGDPMIFGRANEEISGVRLAGIPCEIVPGVTAASAAAAGLGRSLTERETARRIQFVTAHARKGTLPDDLNWNALADPAATTAVYMGVRTLPLLVARLLEHGLPPHTPAVLVEKASWADERRIAAPIADLPELVAGMQPSGPCLLLIGRAMQGAT